MATITINEISRNYNFAAGTSVFATVALPITASWGPGYFDPDSLMDPCGTSTDEEKHSDMLNRTTWQRFPSSQAGLEAFVATYRSPVANYRLAQDYSYQMALTLLTSGYDVLVCRLSPGKKSEATFYYEEIDQPDTHSGITVKAKFPGTFGNNLRVEFKNIGYMSAGSIGNELNYYWSMITYIVDGSGVKNAVENKIFVFDIENSSDTIPYWREVESDFVDLTVFGTIKDYREYTESGEQKRASVKLVNAEEDKQNDTFALLIGGTDYGEIPEGSGDNTSKLLADAYKWANMRYAFAENASLNTGFTYTADERNYVTILEHLKSIREDSSLYTPIDEAKAAAIRFREWVFTHLVGIQGSTGHEGVYDLLKDKLAYNPQRIISPGWDDQDFLYLLDEVDTTYLCGDEYKIFATSPIHRKLMDVAYFSRCATSLLDIPRSLDKKYVYDDDSSAYRDWGYAQKLARYNPDNASYTADVQLYHTHSALFTCWGRYQYNGLTRQTIAPPAFLAIMIQRAMILNQALQYEWILPTDRTQNLRIGKMDYDIPQKLLSVWQSTEGVGVNCITPIPGQGTTLWGNSTLFEVPPATYQALANLSTRYLANAIEDVVYRVGISITFQYNNGEAYSSFRAGVTPILDTMKNAGAIEDYKIKMALDINELDQVNANSVIGTILVSVNGVVQNITVDLIALPPTTSLAQFG